MRTKFVYALITGVVLQFAGLVGLTAAPAQALAVQLSLSASATPIAVGDSVTLSGKATNAKVDTVVHLQRKDPTGWVNVANQTLTSTRLYRFTRSPNLGSHKFRILMPRQLAQPREISPTVTVDVLRRTTMSYAPLRDDTTYNVSGSLTASAPGATVTLEQRIAGVWTPITSGTSPFSLDTTYPNPNPLRLSVTGNAQWLPLVQPLPHARILKFDATLNTPVAITDNLPGGRDIKLNTNVVASDFYSWHPTAELNPNAWSWTDGNGVAGVPYPLPGFPLVQMQNAGASTFSYSTVSTGSLDGKSVTLWTMLERDINAPNTTVSATLGAGRYVRVKLNGVTCSQPNLRFHLNNSALGIESVVHVDGPSGVDSYSTTISGDDTLTHACVAGDWKFTILRSSTAAGNLSMSWEPAA